MAAFALFPAMDSARRMSESKASGPRADRMFLIFSASASIVEKTTRTVQKEWQKREREVFAFEMERVLRCIFILEWDLARKGGAKLLFYNFSRFQLIFLARSRVRRF